MSGVLYANFSPKSLAPGLYAPLTFRAFRAKRDPAMEAIAAVRGNEQAVP